MQMLSKTMLQEHLHWDDALPSFALPRCAAEKNLEQNFSSFLLLTAHL